LIHVDFNDLEDGGRIAALVEDSDRFPIVGQEALLTDDEGNACRATIEDVEGDLIHLALDWSSWNKPVVAALSGGPEAPQTPLQALEPRNTGLDWLDPKDRPKRDLVLNSG
jgi:hypothetical protein